MHWLKETMPDTGRTASIREHPFRGPGRCQLLFSLHDHLLSVTLCHTSLLGPSGKGLANGRWRMHHENLTVYWRCHSQPSNPDCWMESRVDRLQELPRTLSCLTDFTNILFELNYVSKEIVNKDIKILLHFGTCYGLIWSEGAAPEFTHSKLGPLCGDVAVWWKVIRGLGALPWK